MSFAKDVNAFVHSSGEVRDAARELTVAVYEVSVISQVQQIPRRSHNDFAYTSHHHADLILKGRCGSDLTFAGDWRQGEALH